MGSDLGGRMSTALGVPGVLIPGAPAAGGGGGGSIIAVASGDVTVGGILEQTLYSFSLTSANIPGIGDFAQLDSWAVQNTFVSGVDNLRLYIGGVSRLGEIMWHASNGGRKWIRIALQRNDATTLRVFGYDGYRNGPTTQLPSVYAVVGALTFPTTIALRWVGGHASNSITHQGLAVTAYRA